MDNQEQFNKDIEFGRIGEEAYVALVYTHAKTKYIVDVRDDTYFRNNDVDFLQVCTNGMVNKVEVKTDRYAHKSGNIAFETVSFGKPGCLKRSIADYVFYYLYETDTAYMINLHDLKEKLPSYNLKEVPMGENSKGYLIPIKNIMEDKLGWQVQVLLTKGAKVVTTT